MSATNQMMLVALYNAANAELPHQITDKEVSFGLPAALEGEGKNTKVTMTALPDSENFKGEIELHYDRLEPGVMATFVITPKVVDNRIDLATTNGELDGFTA